MNGASAVIYIVDDDADVCQILERLLQSASYQARTFTSTAEFFSGYDPDVPGCIILDLTMPDCDGLQAQSALAASGCARPVIFLSENASVEASVSAIRAGAVDVLIKPVQDDRLFSAVDRALAVDLENRCAAACHDVIARRIGTLTPREREVLKHVVRGQLNKQIAADIGTVEKTVKVHRARVMQKMGARSVAELVQMANCAAITSRDPGDLFRPWMLRDIWLHLAGELPRPPMQSAARRGPGGGRPETSRLRAR